MTSAPLAYADNEEKHNTMRRKKHNKEKTRCNEGKKGHPDIGEGLL